MNAKKYHEAPLVEKMPVSLVVLEGSDLEATAIRASLENFGCRVDTHWLGSRNEFLEILKGTIPTQKIVVLACHGNETGFLLGEEQPISPTDIADQGHLNQKTVISVGCDTGTEEFAASFLKSGGKAYVAPRGYPFGNTALLFVIHMFYELLQHKKKLREAVESARSYDKESEMFTLWEK